MKKVVLGALFLGVIGLFGCSSAGVRTTDGVVNGAQYTKDNFKQQQEIEVKYPQAKVQSDSMPTFISGKLVRNSQNSNYSFLVSFKTHLKGTEVLRLQRVVDTEGNIFTNRFEKENITGTGSYYFFTFITIGFYSWFAKLNWLVDFSIDIPEQYLIAHKDSGIQLKAYPTSSNYQAVTFQIPAYYIQGMLQQ
jgi:hypothetical protein